MSADEMVDDMLVINGAGTNAAHICKMQAAFVTNRAKSCRTRRQLVERGPSLSSICPDPVDINVSAIG